MDNVINFGGMTALITGASSGIGAASATAFGTRGARVLIHYNCQESEAQRILERVRGAGGQGELLRADLTTMDGVRSLVRALAGRRIDILVNNAGSLIQRTPVLNFTEELWEQVLTLNLTSAFFLAKAVLAGMVERKSGFVVNVSSVAARNGGGLGALAYASAKGALSTMTMGLAKEFAPFGIRVNAVSPGTIDTKYHRNFSNDQILNAVKAATPMARLAPPKKLQM